MSSQRVFRFLAIAVLIFSVTSCSSSAELDSATFDFRSKNLSGMNLSRSDFGVEACDGKCFRYLLTGVDLSQAQLDGASFHGVDMVGANLSNVSARGADFSEANLRGVDFSNADLTGSDFRDAVIVGALFDGAVIKDTILEKLLGMSSTTATSSLPQLPSSTLPIEVSPSTDSSLLTSTTIAGVSNSTTGSTTSTTIAGVSNSTTGSTTFTTTLPITLPKVFITADNSGASWDISVFGKVEQQGNGVPNKWCLLLNGSRDWYQGANSLGIDANQKSGERCRTDWTGDLTEFTRLSGFDSRIGEYSGCAPTVISGVTICGTATLALSFTFSNGREVQSEPFTIYLRNGKNYLPTQFHWMPCSDVLDLDTCKGPGSP